MIASTQIAYDKLIAAARHYEDSALEFAAHGSSKSATIALALFEAAKCVRARAERLMPR